MQKHGMPCRLCKGRSAAPCVICGWEKKKPKIKQASEEAEIDNFRILVDFREKLLMGIWKFRMPSIQSLDADEKPIEPEPQAIVIDAALRSHLQWAIENVVRPSRKGVRVHAIAKATTLTEKQVRVIIQNALIRERYPLELNV